MFNIKKHNTDLYNTLLSLSRNLIFYDKINLKDTFETRIYLMFLHFSLIMIVFKKKGKAFPQNKYDDLFFCIENNLRELGYGDIAVNKRMKTFNKILYDILLKINISKNSIEINEKLVKKYFSEFNNLESDKFKLFEHYFVKFYNFCFELSPENMIKDVLNFRL